MVTGLYNVESMASLQRLSPSLTNQASQRSQPSGGDFASSMVNLSERAKQLSSAEGKAEMKALAGEIRSARANADTSTKEGTARLRADIQGMTADYVAQGGRQQKPGTSSDPAANAQVMQQSGVTALAQSSAVAFYMSMSLIR